MNAFEGIEGISAEDLGPVDELPRELINQENRDLTDKLRKIEARGVELESEVDENQQRLGIVKEHYKYLRAEVQNTQSIVEAKTRELESERHLKTLADREVGKIKKDLENLDKEKAVVQERLNGVQNSIFRANERLDQFRVQMNWNQEELEQWAMAEKQKDEDQLAIERYRRADESRVKELNLQLEKLQKLMISKREELEREITETQATQIELDKTAQDFKQLHHERQQLLDQWEDAVAAMGRRDEEIDVAEQHILDSQEELKAKEQSLVERQSFLEREMENNRTLEKEIGGAERQLVRLREEYGSFSGALQALEDELSVLKNTLSKTSSDINKTETNIRVHEEQIRRKEEQLQRCEEKDAIAKEDLATHTRIQGDLDQEAKKVEDILVRTQQRLKAVERELNDLKEQQYKKNSALYELRAQEANLITEIAGCRSQNKNMMAKLHQLDSESFKQQELLYNIEYQIQQMERKVNRAEGDRSEEEKAIFQERIRALQEELDAATGKCKMLENQVKRVVSDVRKATVAASEKERQKMDIDERIMSLRLENETATTELKNLTHSREDILVEHDSLKLQVTKLRELLNLRADEVCGLENRKTQLEITQQEREHELSVYRETLRAELRMMTDERSKLNKELAERQAQVDRLKNRFEILMTRMRAGDLGDEDEGSGETTQAKFIIRAAQEREELQKTGDQLDQRIQKLLKEEKAMRKSLNLLRAKNIGFSQSFKKADTGGSEAQKKKDLDEKLHRARASLQRMRTEMLEIEDINDKLMSDLQFMDQKEKGELQNRIRELEEQHQQLEREASEHEQRLESYNRQIQRYCTSLRQKAGNPEEPCPEEQDLMIQDLRERNQEAITQLLSLGKFNPEFRGRLEMLLQEYGLQRPGSRSGRSVSSRASDRPDSAYSQSSYQSGVSRGSEASQSSQQPQQRRRGVAPTRVEIGL